MVLMRFCVFCWRALVGFAVVCLFRCFVLVFLLYVGFGLVVLMSVCFVVVNCCCCCFAVASFT